MNIFLPDSILSRMLRYCKTSLPLEAVGAFTGQAETSAAHVTGFTPLANRAAQPLCGFAAEPAEWIELLYKTHSRNEAIVGIVHSHPAAPPFPSERDRVTLWHTVPSHWIISFAQLSRPAVAAWRFAPDGTCSPVSWVVTD